MGPWHHPDSEHHRRAWPPHFEDRKLYTRITDTDNTYQIWTQEENRSHYTIAGAITHIYNIPLTAIPADTRRRFPVGYSILLSTTSHDITAEMTISHHESATQFSQSLDPWEAELISATQFMTDEIGIVDTISIPSIIACDGAVNSHEAGAFGWVLSNRERNRKAVCAGPVRGSRITLYRAEGYGIPSVALRVKYNSLCFVFYFVFEG